MATAHPPIVHHSTTRLEPADALALLHNYIQESLSHAHLHPDALLTERGPQFASSSEEGGLALHHLRRVEAGLRGERLDDVDPGRVGMAAIADVQGAGNVRKESSERAAKEETGDGDWRDMDSYNREQAIEGGEQGDRVSEGVPVGGRRGSDVPTVRSTDGPSLSKEDRKKAKKERSKGDKRAREERRRREKAMEADDGVH